MRRTFSYSIICSMCACTKTLVLYFAFIEFACLVFVEFMVMQSENLTARLWLICGKMDCAWFEFQSQTKFEVFWNRRKVGHMLSADAYAWIPLSINYHASKSATPVPPMLSKPKQCKVHTYPHLSFLVVWFVFKFLKNTDHFTVWNSHPH